MNKEKIKDLLKICVKYQLKEYAKLIYKNMINMPEY